MPTATFVADGHSEIGGGHVIRSLALAAALGARGLDCRFLGGHFVRNLVAVFGERSTSWLETAQSGSPNYVASLKAKVAELDPDLVVFDHYKLDADAHRAIANGRPSVLIDELIDRPLSVDIIIDGTPGRQANAYDGLLQSTPRFMFGPKYALLRPRFATARAEGRRNPERPVRNVLLTMGLTDLGGVTGRVTQAVYGALGDRTLEIVGSEAGSSYPQLRALSESDERVVFRSQVRDMAELMERADICLGAGGGTTWERCALGLPTILTIIAENQRQSAEQLRDAGAALVLDLGAADYGATLVETFRALCDDADLRRRLSEASATVCDGRGAERVADAILELLEKRNAR